MNDPGWSTDYLTCHTIVCNLQKKSLPLSNPTPAPNSPSIGSITTSESREEPSTSRAGQGNPGITTSYRKEELPTYESIIMATDRPSSAYYDLYESMFHEVVGRVANCLSRGTSFPRVAHILTRLETLFYMRIRQKQIDQ